MDAEWDISNSNCDLLLGKHPPNAIAILPFAAISSYGSIAVSMPASFALSTDASLSPRALILTPAMDGKKWAAKNGPENVVQRWFVHPHREYPFSVPERPSTIARRLNAGSSGRGGKFPKGRLNGYRGETRAAFPSRPLLCIPFFATPVLPFIAGFGRKAPRPVIFFPAREAGAGWWSRSGRAPAFPCRTSSFRWLCPQRPSRPAPCGRRRIFPAR